MCSSWSRLAECTEIQLASIWDIHQTESYGETLTGLTWYTCCEELQIVVVSAMCAVREHYCRVKILHPSLLLLAHTEQSYCAAGSNGS